MLSRKRIRQKREPRQEDAIDIMADKYPKNFKIFIVGNFFSHIIYVSMKKGEPEISILHLKEETK